MCIRDSFNAEYGLLNFILDNIGLSDYKNHNWLGNVRTANAALIGFSLCYVGYFMVIMLAKTASISEDYYDAAKIDGASLFTVYWKILLPMMRPVFFTSFVILVHISIKSYDLIVALTQGGPGISTTCLLYTSPSPRDGLLSRMPSSA